MYKRILVPLDGSKLAEQVLPYAGAIAKGLNTRLELLHVVDLRPLSITDPMTARYFDYEGLKKEAEDYLRQLSEPLVGEGVDIAMAVAEGVPASIILDSLEKQPDTLVAITTHGRSGLARWVMGSTAEKILHTTNNPMLLVRAREEEAIPSNVKLEKMILPLDGSKTAEQILPHAAALAKALLLEIYAVRATPSVGDYQRYMEEHIEVGPGPTVSRVFSGPYEEFSKSASAQIMEYLHSIGDKLRAEGVLSVEERLLQGQPADAIIDFAHELSNNLVAMTSHGRSGIGRWLMGSVTDRVVRYSDDPVLVVRAS